MPYSVKAYVVIICIGACPFFAFSQAVDSMRMVKTDTLVATKQFTPDTIYIGNGDKITGNIISYEEGRLRIDAQSAGIINIRNQKIRSISGGSRLFYLRDIRNNPYVGNIRSSSDSGEILLAAKSLYHLQFNEIISFRPVKSATDTAQPAVVKSNKFDKLHTADTLLLKNRERYTGRILSMEQGRVKIDAQGAGMVNVKWHNIRTIIGGSRQYKIEDQQGDIYIGRIIPSKDTGEIDIEGEQKYSMMLENIVRMYPLEEDWYRGFKGTLGGGFNYAKSSELLNINFDYNLYYVVKRWRIINNFSYVETSTHEEDRSVRLSTDLTGLYSLKGQWVLSELVALNRNDELGIKSRISFGTGGGYNLIVTEKARLLALSGILQNTEKNIESSASISNFELPVTLQHTIYSFIRPDLSTTTEIAYYKGLTESKRYRVDISADISWEFIKWTKLKLSVYYDYDNKEVEGKNSKEDYGTVISLLIDLK
jgi:hypothetical protein